MSPSVIASSRTDSVGRQPSQIGLAMGPKLTRYPTIREYLGDAEVGVRDRAPAGPRDQADPRQLGRGRLGARPGRPRAEPRAAGRVHEAAQIMTTPIAGEGGVDAYARLAELGISLPAV